MQLTLDRPAGINIINAVSPGEIRIGERLIRSSAIIGARDIISDWPVSAMPELDTDAMESALALEPEIVILGTGRSMVFPGRDIYAQALSRNVGLEVMDTAAACRTFNILVTEGRSVVAALIVD